MFYFMKLGKLIVDDINIVVDKKFRDPDHQETTDE